MPLYIYTSISVRYNSYANVMCLTELCYNCSVSWLRQQRLFNFTLESYHVRVIYEYYVWWITLHLAWKSSVWKFGVWAGDWPSVFMDGKLEYRPGNRVHCFVIFESLNLIVNIIYELRRISSYSGNNLVGLKNFYESYFFQLFFYVIHPDND